ncbi:MAG: acyltransferase [Lachnospiraceae bacterium]|nr:acyltransferase [Lachnospiraceae bacterium]
MKKEEKRESWIFMPLGLFILSALVANVCAGLSGTDWYLGANVYLKGIQTILCSFSMQLFFLIAGYLYGKKKIADFGQYRSFAGKHLLKVGVFYIIWSVIYWGVKYVFGSFVEQKMTFTHLTSIFVRPIEFLWLIYAYFVVFLFVTLCIQVFEKKKRQNWLLGIFFAMLFVPLFMSVKVRALYYLMRYAFYFYVGVRFAAKKEKKEDEISITVFLLGLLFYVCLATQMGFGLEKTMLSVFSTLTGALFFFTLGYAMKDYHPSKKWICKIVWFLQETGKSAVPIYLLHVPALAAVRILLSKLGFRFEAIWLQFPLGILIGWAVPFFFYQAVKKIKWIDVLFYPDRNQLEEEI